MSTSDKDSILEGWHSGRKHLLGALLSSTRHLDFAGQDERVVISSVSRDKNLKAHVLETKGGNNIGFFFPPCQYHEERMTCLEDHYVRLALKPQKKYKIQTKPHGHGDVHSLLYSSGILKVWYDSNNTFIF